MELLSPWDHLNSNFVSSLLAARRNVSGSPCVSFITMISMGNGGGSITPNEAIRNENSQTVNKTANVSFNISANDTQGFDELLVQRRGVIISVINEALNDQGRPSLA